MMLLSCSCYCNADVAKRGVGSGTLFAAYVPFHGIDAASIFFHISLVI